MSYKSQFKKLVSISFPEFSGTRVLMMPLTLEDIETLPNDLAHYKQTVLELIAVSPVKEGVAYLTIDERKLEQGQTLRRKGLHVDGMGAEGKLENSLWATSGLKSYVNNYWNDKEKKWQGENAAGIGGMVTASSVEGCRAWQKEFSGRIKFDGDCEALRDQFPESESTVFEAGVAYWCNAACVHESLPMKGETERAFIRLSMPSTAPWYMGYTKNPKGVLPTGLVVSRLSVFCVGEPEVILNG